MWVITGPFDGAEGDLDIQKQKFLKPNKSYILGRKGKPLSIFSKRISAEHCEFIVGEHSLDDAGDPSVIPTLRIVNHIKKGKGMSFARLDGTTGVLEPMESMSLQPEDRVGLISRAAVTVSWKPLNVYGKDVSVASCAELGVKLLSAPHKDTTHHLISHYAANMVTASALVANSVLVKPEWLREVVRRGNLSPDTDSESLEAEFVLPQESKFRPAFSPSLMPAQKTFALWQPNEARLKMFHAHRFVCIQEKTRESDGELRDTVRLGDGEIDTFDVSLGVAKFRAAITRSRNKEGKTTVLIGDADLMQLAVGKDTWGQFVAEARSFDLQIIPPSKVIQAILEADVQVLSPGVLPEEDTIQKQQRELSPLPEMVPNSMASEPSMPQEAPRIPEDPPPEPAPTPPRARRLVRRVTSRAPSTEPSIPPTFPLTSTSETAESLLRPRKQLTRRVVGTKPILTGLAEDPSIVLDEPPKLPPPKAPVSSGQTAEPKVPPTPMRNSRLKRRVVDGNIVHDSDFPGIGMRILGAVENEKGNGEPPLKKFKALFESTNPGGSSADTFEILNSIPIDSASQLDQTQTQTQTQTQSSDPAAPRTTGRFGGRKTASALNVLREEEEEGTQSMRGTVPEQRGTKRAADEDVDMSPADDGASGANPAAKKRAIEHVNAVERGAQAPAVVGKGVGPPAASKAVATKEAPGAPVGKPDKDSAFLKAVASSKRGKKTEDEFDREFNKLKISKPLLDAREDDREAEWKVLADFGDDSGLRGNFMTIVEIDVFRKDGQDARRCRNPEWDGKPNFKKFKKKVVNSRPKINLFPSDANDYGVGAAYWKGRDSSQNANQTQGMFGSEMQTQIKIAGTPGDHHTLFDSELEEEAPLPKSRKTTSRAGSVRPSRAGSAAPVKKATTKGSTKRAPAKSAAALFLDSDDEIKEEDEDDIIVEEDNETMTLHSSAETRAPVVSRRTSSRATAASKAAKVPAKSKKAAPIVVVDDSDDDVFQGFGGR